MDPTMPETTEAVDAPAPGDTERSASPHGAALSMGADELTRRLDRINLTQALLDFEIANARVLDLTSRVVDANKRVLKLQAQADESRAALDGAHAGVVELERRLAEVEGSTSYRAARKLGSLRSLLRLLRS